MSAKRKKGARLELIEVQISQKVLQAGCALHFKKGARLTFGKKGPGSL